MTNNRYIVKNCPASSKEFRLNCQGKAYIDKYKCVYGLLECQDCTDCVIKQVIQVCNEYSDKWEDCDFSNGLSDEIFKLFDIEDVRE